MVYILTSDPEYNNIDIVGNNIENILKKADETYIENMNPFKKGFKNIKNIFRLTYAKLTRNTEKKKKLLEKIIDDYISEKTIICTGDIIGDGLIKEIINYSSDENQFLKNLKKAYESIFENISKKIGNNKYYFILGNHDIKSDIFKDWWIEWVKNEKYNNIVWLGYLNYKDNVHLDDETKTKIDNLYQKINNIGVIEGSPEVPVAWGSYGIYTNTYQGVSDDEIKKIFDKAKDKSLIIMHKGYSKKEGDEEVIEGNLPSNDFTYNTPFINNLIELLKNKDKTILCGHWHNRSLFKKNGNNIINPGNKKMLILAEGKLHTKEI